MQRVGRIAVHTLLWLFVGIAVLLLGLLTAIQFKPVRMFARDQVLAALKGSVRGDLYIADLRWPGFDHIELSGVSLHDQNGAPVLTLPSLIVRLRLHALLKGQLQIDHIDLDHLYVDLGALDDQAGLLSTFGSDEPKPPKPAAAKSDSMSPIAVNIDELCLREGQVAVQPDDARQLLLRRIAGCVHLGVAKDLRIELKELRAELLNRGKPVLTLVPNGELAELADAAAQGGAESMQVGLEGSFVLGQAMAFDGDVRVRQLSRATLDSLAVDGSFLHAPLQVDAHAHTVKTDIAYRVDMLAASSKAQLFGTWSETKQLYAQLESDHLELQHFSDSQLAPLGFKLVARADLSSEQVMKLRASLQHARLGEAPLPTLWVEGSRDQQGAIELAQLLVLQGSARIEARGGLDPDGAARAQVEIAMPDLKALPALQQFVAGLSGGLSGRAQLQRAASGQLKADANLAVQTAKLQDNAADSIALQLHATGSQTQPHVDLQVAGRGLVLGSERVSEVVASLRGGPEFYELNARAPDHDLVLDGWLVEEPPGWSAGIELGAKLQNEPLQLSIRRAFLESGSYLQIDELRAHYLGARVYADGRMQLGDKPAASTLRFGAAVPKLADITRKFMQKELPGRIELVGSARSAPGSVAAPLLKTHLRWMNGPAFDKHESELAVYAQADLANARAEVSVQTQAGHARATAKLESRWRKGQPLGAALKRAQHELVVQARGVPVEALASSGDKPAPIGLRGLLTGELKLKGNQSALQLQTSWQADIRAGRDPNVLALALNGRYEKAKLELELKAHDHQGELISLSFLNRLDVEKLLAGKQGPAGPELIEKTHWEAHGKFEKRRVRELPLVYGLGLEKNLSPLTVATKLDLTHEPGQEPAAELETDLLWEPQTGPAASARTAGDANSQLEACTRLASGEVSLSGKLSGGLLHVALTAQSREHEVVRVESDLHAPLKDLLGGRADRVGPTGAAIRVTDLDLSQIPIVCERGRGVVNAQISGKDLFAALADLQIKVLAENMQWDESPPLAMRLKAYSDGDALAVRTRLQTGDGELRIDGALPIAFRTKDPLLVVDRARGVALTTHWKAVDLASVLAYAPGVARSSGTLDGKVDVSGTLTSLRGNGTLDLHDVSFTLPQLGQRFSHLNMKALVDKRSLRLSEGRFNDLDGSASIAAQVSFDKPEYWLGELNLNARNFPVRKSGVMMGRADAGVKVAAKITPTKADVDVKLSDVAIQLTTSDMGSVQSLDPDPEVHFVDAVLLRDEPEPVDDGGQTRTTSTAQINIETTAPLWIRRDDFAIQMSAKLKVLLGGQAPDMSGTIELHRGYLSLLGTSFDVKRGRVTLTGGERVDPQLEITAENTTPAGAKVQLEVTGFVGAPKLAFSINGQTVTAGEAMLALSGRGDPAGSKNMEDQVASAAIGMTTGLLSLGARREFGDWVPMLSFEQGDQTRVRVGFEADKLIPKFMRGFVRGAYVEGIVSSGSGNNSGGQYAASAGAETNTATGSGVLLELNLPKSLVWAGQYGPGAAWSVDLDWRP